MRRGVAIGALLAAACGAGRTAGPPRSTCVAAAASIAQGLRLASPADAERAADLEPRFAHACRTSRWRPNVVRCFALARDPAEHRVCARRLEPPQRQEARVIQDALYGAPSARVRGSPPAAAGCRGLLTTRDALLACDLLPPPLKIELARDLEILVRSVPGTAATGGPASAADLAVVCDHMIDQVRRLLLQVGC
jgi:hypothetical protein